MKTYLRLLGFASPIEKYAIPYFIFSIFYAIFNTFNFVMIIPIVSALFIFDGLLLCLCGTSALSDSRHRLFGC